MLECCLLSFRLSSSTAACVWVAVDFNTGLFIPDSQQTFYIKTVLVNRLPV